MAAPESVYDIEVDLPDERRYLAAKVEWYGDEAEIGVMVVFEENQETKKWVQLPKDEIQYEQWKDYEESVLNEFFKMSENYSL